MDIHDGLYRHELLAPGVLGAPNSVHMHFELGAHRDVQRKLCERLARFGATPKESVIVEPGLVCMVSLPVNSISELSSHGSIGLRLLDDFEIEPCAARLERVVARMRPDRKIQIAGAMDISAWQAASAGYVASHGRAMEIHHSVSFPRNGSAAPPISLQEVASRSNGLNVAGWSIFIKPDAWCFRSSRSIKANGDLSALLERDAAKLASLYKDVAPGMEISITIEEVIASWSYPLQATDSNRSRRSVKQVMGTSERRLPNFADVVSQCKTAHADKPLVLSEADRARLIANIDPFRRIAIAQRFDPIVIGIALIPATARPGRPEFADHFCSQVAAYGETQQEAEALVDAYREAMWFLVRSGSGPIAAYDEGYEKVFYWATILAGAKPARKEPIENPVIAVEEKVFSIVQSSPPGQYSREETLEFLTSRIGRSRNPRLSNAGFLMIPFRTVTRSGGEHLRGAQFALVSSPEMSLDRLEGLALRQHIMLQLAPFGAAEPPKQNSVVLRRPAHITHALDHDKLWDAFDVVLSEPEGTRMALIEAEFPEAFALFKRYPNLEKLKKEIEHTSKSTDIVERAWTAIAKLDRSGLYKWRKKAGLPPRRLRKSAKRRGDEQISEDP